MTDTRHPPPKPQLMPPPYPDVERILGRDATPEQRAALEDAFKRIWLWQGVMGRGLDRIWDHVSDAFGERDASTQALESGSSESAQAAHDALLLAWAAISIAGD